MSVSPLSQELFNRAKQVHEDIQNGTSHSIVQMPEGLTKSQQRAWLRNGGQLPVESSTTATTKDSQ